MKSSMPKNNGWVFSTLKPRKNNKNLKVVQKRLGLNNLDNAKSYKKLYKKYQSDIRKTELVEKLLDELI